MRDVNRLTKSKTEKARAINNSMAWEPNSMQEAIQQVVQVWKGRPLISCITNYNLLSLHNPNKLLELLTEYDELFDGTLGD